MKKIGIITFHDVLNYGATLQAYALCTALRNWGYEADVINYLNPKMGNERSIWYQVKHIDNPVDKVLSVLRVPQRRKMQKVFDAFIAEKMYISGPRILNPLQLRELSSRYDAIISGSDQVFNYIGTGEDFGFYLEDIFPSVKRIAYAPSFGLTNIDQAHTQRVGQCLRRFNALSAREVTGKELINAMIGLEVPVVVDPTFLLNNRQWKEMSITSKVSSPYVLLYSFGSTELEGVALQKAKSIGGKVINVNRPLPSLSGDIVNVVAPSPSEFIGLIDAAYYVVTNSFHGMALSINMHKQFTVFVNNYSNSANTNPRFHSLAEKLNLQKQIRVKGESLSDNIIDYDKVQSKLDEWILASKLYLENAINE